MAALAAAAPADHFAIVMAAADLAPTAAWAAYVFKVNGAAVFQSGKSPAVACVDVLAG
jgi:hypothetical protein